MRQSLVLMAGADDRRAQLRQRIAQLRTGLAALAAQRGWHLLPSHTAVQALVVGSNEAALALMDSLRAQGLWVPAIRPPTVPAGTARLRIALSSAHTPADVDRLLRALGATTPVASSAATHGRSAGAARAQARAVLHS